MPSYNQPWKVEDATIYCGSDQMGDVMSRMVQDNRDPLTILIEEEEEDETDTE